MGTVSVTGLHWSHGSACINLNLNYKSPRKPFHERGFEIPKYKLTIDWLHHPPKNNSRLDDVTPAKLGEDQYNFIAIKELVGLTHMRRQTTLLPFEKKGHNCTTSDHFLFMKNILTPWSSNHPSSYQSWTIRTPTSPSKGNHHFRVWNVPKSMTMLQ